MKAIVSALRALLYLNLGYTDYKELGPGEIAVMDSDGIKTIVQPGKDMKICTFLWFIMVIHPHPMRE